MLKDKITKSDENKLLSQIKAILEQARQKVAHTVNTTVIEAYWQIGRHIVEFEQEGQSKAGYGRDLINQLSKKLTVDYGEGFSATNIRYMRQFYLAFPIYHAVSDKLSWTHIRALLKVQNPDARDYYMKECVALENYKQGINNL